MSYLAYQEYKDSQVEWLGQVPAEWDVVPLKSVAWVVNGYPFPSENFGVDGQWPLIRIRDLNKDIPATFFDGEPVDQAAIDNSDVLIGMDGDFNVGRWLGDVPAMLNQRMCAVRSDDPVVTRLLFHAVPIPLEAINAVTYSTTVKHLSSSQVANCRFAFPPDAQERQAIAAFLDRETAKIDAAVAAQERLIALLAEKRAATISHAVTKGLDPDAPMKDSGIEWLGQIPAHWGIPAVWMIFEMGRGRVLSHEDIHENPGCYPVYSSQTARDGMMGSIGSFDFDGDYLTWTTDGAHAGTVFQRSGKFNCTNVCGTLRPLKEMNLTFARYAISQATRYFVRQDINPKLMNDVMAGIRIAMPPISEQREIGEKLWQLDLENNATVLKAEKMIALLKERRAALISAAVTGKIDVRGEVDAEKQEAA